MEATDSVLDQQVKAILESLTTFRHDIHQHPERGFKEVRTQKQVKEYLLKIGVAEAEIRPCAETGLVVDIKGTAENVESKGISKIALRADMDALGMTEENSHLPYVSQNVGVAHMCGHDGHMTCLLGGAQIIVANRNKIPSNQTVRLLFQPAEEGPGGAPVMINEGCLDGVDEVYGMHNWPALKVGELITTVGPCMAHVTEFSVIVHGKGGHGSQPHKTIDPVICVAHLVCALQTIISRNVCYDQSAVFSVTQIHTGEAFNVIPSSATFGGTIRDLSPEVFETIKRRFYKLIENTCAAFDCTPEITFSPMYPAVVNHKNETEHVVRVGKAMGLKVSSEGLPMLAAEDFSYFLEKVPGCFLFLGGSGENETRSMCHSPKFDWNDDITPIGVKVWVRLVEDRLGVQLV
eukprot:TRINITY_DN113_c0_g1_i1.p1 TRINITY_DN113_c0_g1~~TRINITY_DN113_c0_g1_i1.p1  ORF type:complete len:406 (+),score=69.50 TRINITY_DN113_c0_g1_i1:81-1298(+)